MLWCRDSVLATVIEIQNHSRWWYKNQQFAAMVLPPSLHSLYSLIHWGGESMELSLKLFPVIVLAWLWLCSVFPLVICFKENFLWSLIVRSFSTFAEFQLNMQNIWCLTESTYFLKVNHEILYNIMSKVEILPSKQNKHS